MEFDFSPNPSPTIRTIQVGNEQQPVLVVDNCLRNPKSVVDFAATALQFGPPKQMYPGIVAPAPQQYALGLLGVIAPIIRDTFKVRIESVQINSFFAIVTVRPEQLNLGQRLPHIDTPNPNQIAVLHYLCGPEHGGTAFYRHRGTGFESLDDTKFQQMVEMLKQDAEAHGHGPAQYLTTSNRLYEQIGAVEAAFNRVLIYRSRVLHSASIAPAANFSPDPRVGRLTANTFLAFE